MTTIVKLDVRMLVVEFIPTWEDEAGIRHTLLGTAQIECADLPTDLQDRLYDFCRDAYREHIKQRKGIA